MVKQQVPRRRMRLTRFMVFGGGSIALLVVVGAETYPSCSAILVCTYSTVPLLYLLSFPLSLVFSSLSSAQSKVQTKLTQTSARQPTHPHTPESTRLSPINHVPPKRNKHR